MGDIMKSVEKSQDWTDKSIGRVKAEMRLEALMRSFFEVALGLSDVLAGPTSPATLSSRLCLFLEWKLRETAGTRGRALVTAFTVRAWRDMRRRRTHLAPSLFQGRHLGKIPNGRHGCQGESLRGL